MKLIKTILLVVCLQYSLLAKENYIDLNFKNLTIKELIQLTSKALNKNILYTGKLDGKVDFIATKKVKESELLNLVTYVLEEKGYSLIENNDILRVVKLNDAARQNVPVIKTSLKNSSSLMVTKIIKVDNSNVDYISSRVRHIMSKNGKLVTEKNSNVLVATDFKQNVQTVQKIVNLMTKDAKKVAEVVKLKNIKASDAKENIENIAKSLFNQRIEKNKVTVIETKENNSLMLIGQKTNIDFLKSHIKQIDIKDSLAKKIVDVIYLKNVESTNVIKILDSIISKKRYINIADKPAVTVDEETNSIILMGMKSEIDGLKSLISKLDKEKAQVYVHARIIEVNDNLVNEIGFKYGIFGWSSGDKGLSSFSTSLNRGSVPSLNSVSDLGLEIKDLSSALALGASLNLLKENGAVDVVSEPSILAVNNKESSIYVGETISIRTASSLSDGGTSKDSFTREDIGLTLKVKPRISNDTKVTLDINTILEDVNTTSNKGAGGNPDTNKKEVKTTAIVNNGESVIIGGLIQNKEAKTNQKVPLLGDIPLVGQLFNNNVTQTKKNNLVIIVTPYLIPKSKDITYIRSKLSELKLLEDRYLKDALKRLKKKKIEQNKTNQKEEKIEDANSFNSSIETNKQKENKAQQRFNEYLGI
ncbi:secretin N-terminal domain-containing protein [Arcobacter sp. CECT 8985]|uniref:secretin N-terminal domain-containing protein n=1 Tax=Arcobacter sp. CECT 8985 TaxID=1935424 RepID=UPI00100C1DCA|nr:secretin N-terminal domain-containing protein [Arcobacter sp. CECT 8985]RXJ86840.1 hypothetical protein CRU93_06455 [Arcobacter sp. CECT 8985]